jgi:hypothetical protein
MLDDRDIRLETDFVVDEVDPRSGRWSPSTDARCRSTCW